MTKLPHFVLFSRSEEQAVPGDSETHEQEMHGGIWHFRIQTDAGHVVLKASDFEPNVSRERLELLAVVRGLEAFDEPSQVTLVTPNPQISRSVRQGLDYWRDRNWMWERFGEKVPMRNCDLWIRIDRAIQIHQVRCRTFRVDGAHQPVPKSKAIAAADVKPLKRRRSGLVLRPVFATTRWVANGLNGMADSLRNLTPESAPNPHPT